MAGLGGKRAGAGKKKGSTASHTKEALEKKRHIQSRVGRNINKLVNAQLNLAQGCTYLYRIDKETNTKGKEVQKHALVTDEEEILAYLDGNQEDGNYYYITTDKPDNRAIENLLDRAYGRPAQTLEVPEGEGEIVVRWKK